MHDIQYTDGVERIHEFRILGRKIDIFREMRSYFGMSKSLVEISDYYDILQTISDTTGIVVSNEIDRELFYAILYLKKGDNIPLFSGRYDHGESTYLCHDIAIYTESAADIWYAGLPKEHREFVDELIDKRCSLPACGTPACM